MSAKLTLIRGARCADHDRPSGYTPKVLEALATANVLLEQAEGLLQAAPVEEDSEADFEITDALENIKEAGTS